MDGREVGWRKGQEMGGGTRQRRKWRQNYTTYYRRKKKEKRQEERLPLDSNHGGINLEKIETSEEGREKRVRSKELLRNSIWVAPSVSFFHPCLFFAASSCYYFLCMSQSLKKGGGVGVGGLFLSFLVVVVEEVCKQRRRGEKLRSEFGAFVLARMRREAKRDDVVQ